MESQSKADAVTEIEPMRRIQISILDEEKDVVFSASGNVSRITAHKFLEGVGYAFIPHEPIRATQGRAMPMGRISCLRRSDCTDYPVKCSECANNVAESYFIKKIELPVS